MTAEEIHKIRLELKMNQTEFAAFIGVSKRTVANYEAGQTEPNSLALHQLQKAKSKVATLRHAMSDINEILFESDPENININEPLEIFNTKSGNNIEELPDGKYLLTVPMVPHKAHATYISEFQDAEFISDLTKVSFIVDRVPKGKYLAWEIQNDSMNDAGPDSKPSRDAILHGDIVLARELGKQHWKSKFNTREYPYWIIVHKNTILCKEIIQHDVERGIITCHSLNTSPEFQDFELNLNEVRQLFNIIKKQV